MEGMTRAEVDVAESKDFALGGGPMPIRDAATLILLDRRQGDIRLLMGRRSRAHRFMPGKLVFPGGRTDPADARIMAADALLPAVEAKLLAGRGSKISATRARAIAMSALRETYEEAGLLIGRKADFRTNSEGWRGFAEHGVEPMLANLRLVARAITPPGRVRRFDTRFIAAWRDDVAVELADGGPTQELEELVWLSIADARQADTPMITRTILGDLAQRLADDPDLAPDAPVPFYHLRHQRFVRDLL
ncbi:MAG: NUDIX hydrolase [Mesorhizobium sp.]|nr:NUDIX hydrolase [Mesorhizobium sp.]